MNAGEMTTSESGQNSNQLIILTSLIYENVEERWKCSYCEKDYKSKNKAENHEKRCSVKKNPHKYELYTCNICKQTFKYLAGKLKHEKKHEPPGGFLCTYCQLSFTSDAERTLHKENVHKFYKCQICTDRFSSEDEYYQHIKEKHEGKSRLFYVCSVCGSQYKTHSQLKQHNDSKCGTIKIYSCQECGSKFMTPNTLNAHMLIHNGEKKHLCDYCGNSFLSKGQLKVHERSHTGEKPFKCNVCGKSFSYRESLVTHSSIHTGIKPYMCEGCGNRFSCIGNLIKHRKSRPNLCGLPQFCKNTKIAPRASAKNPGSLTITNEKEIPAKISRISNGIIKTIVSEMPPLAPISKLTANVQNQVLIPTVKPSSTESAPVPIQIFQTDLTDTLNVDGSIAETEIISMNNTTTDSESLKMESFMNELQTIPKNDETSTEFIANADSMDIVSNVEIEYITSDVQVEEEEVETQELEKEKKDIKDHLTENIPKVDDEYGPEQFQMEFIDNINCIEEDPQNYDGSWQNDTYENDVEKESICLVNYQSGQFTVNSVKKENKSDVQTTKVNKGEEIVIPEMIDRSKITQKLEIEPAYSKESTEKPIRFRILMKRREGVVRGVISSEEKETQVAMDNIGEAGQNYLPISIQDNDNLKTNETMLPNTDTICTIEAVHLVDTINEIEITYPSQINVDPVRIDEDKISMNDTNMVEVENVRVETIDEEFEKLDTLTKYDSFQDGFNNTKYICNYCPKQYCVKRFYQKHMEQEHQLHTADVPNQTDEPRIIRKRNGKFKKEDLTCRICHKQYVKLTSLRKHEPCHGVDGTLLHKCSYCPLYFATLTEADKHQREVHLKLECKECKKKFTDVNVMNAHMRESHNIQLVPHKKYCYVCPTCGRNFSAKIALFDHERSACGENPIYKCHVCEKRYHSAGSLKTHQSVHTGALPHLCKYCGKAFRTQGQVKVHERKHNGDKPFKCEFCDKSFAYRESLLTHLSLHTGVRRFMCQACGLRFSCISNLQAHRKSHRSTCGQSPNVTKPVGPMEVIKLSTKRKYKKNDKTV